MTNNSYSALKSFPARLRGIREQEGIGVRELAKRAGVTPALISLVERGKVRPSVNTLYAIAGALGVPASELLAEPVREKMPFVVQQASERVYVTSKTGKLRYDDASAVSDGFGPMEMSPVIVRLHKRSFMPQNASLRGDQLIYCLDGKIDYACDDEVFKLTPGDSLFFDSHIPHGPHAIHSTTAEYLVCYVDELYGWLDMRLDFRNSLSRPPKAPEGMSPPQRLAWRIRYARAKRGYLQTTVRGLTGLSHGMLSHIESGRAVPSLATVEVIAQTLDIPMSYFFDDQSEMLKTSSVRDAARVMEERDEGGHRYRACPLVHPKFGMPLFTPEFRSYQRRGFVPEQSERPGQLFVMVLSGKIEFRYDEQTFRLGTDDAVYGYSDAPHGLERVISARADVLRCESNLSQYLVRMLRPRRRRQGR